MEKKKKALVSAAKRCAAADKRLEEATAGKHIDLIGVTVQALKKRNVETLPKESLAVGKWLGRVMQLHGELVRDFGMDFYEARELWFPILNHSKGGGEGDKKKRKRK